MGRKVSEKYYEVWVNGGFDKGYKQLDSAKNSVRQRKAEGYDARIKTFSKNEIRTVDNATPVINGTFAVINKEYGILSGIKTRDNGIKVYSWHQNGDGRHIQLFGNNLAALAVAKHVDGKIKAMSYASVHTA